MYIFLSSNILNLIRNYCFESFANDTMDHLDLSTRLLELNEVVYRTYATIKVAVMDEIVSMIEGPAMTKCYWRSRRSFRFNASW
jgi:hypothetical protein